MCDLKNDILEFYLEQILIVHTELNSFNQTVLRKEFKNCTIVFSITPSVPFSVSVFKKNQFVVTSEELENYIMNLWKTKFQVRLDKPKETEV